MAFARSSDFLVVGELGQSFQQLPAEGNLLQIGVRYLIFSLYPCCCLCRSVVLQPAVGVGDLHAKIFVYCAVLSGFRILQILCLQ